MYVYKYSLDIYLLCMIKIKVRWCTVLFCPTPLHFVFENSKNTRIELARPVLGTIFLVVCLRLSMGKQLKNHMLKCIGGTT